MLARSCIAVRRVDKRDAVERPVIWGEGRSGLRSDMRRPRFGSERKLVPPAPILAMGLTTRVPKRPVAPISVQHGESRCGPGHGELVAEDKRGFATLREASIASEGCGVNCGDVYKRSIRRVNRERHK